MNVPRSVGQGRLSEESLPGIKRAIAYVRDPVSAAQDCLPRGASNSTLVVRWQTAESRWTREPDDHTVVFKPREDLPAATQQRSGAEAGEWRQALGDRNIEHRTSNGTEA